MIVQEATIGDVAAVLDQLSEQNRSELDALGITNWQALKNARSFLASGEGWTLFLKHRPAYVFGVVESGHGTTSTWFLGTAAYFATGAAGIRQARSLLKAVGALYGTLTTKTLSTHPDVERWFRVLGFRKVSEGEDGRVFERVTNPKASASFQG